MSVDFERLSRLEPLYEDNFETKKQLGNKVLTMLLGPAGAGKSTIVRQIEAFQDRWSDATWGEPGSLVTRHRRPDDPALYETADEGVTLESVAERVDRQTLTNFSVHPSGNLYATGPEHFVFDYNISPILPSSVASLQRAGFAATHTVFVTAEPADLRAGLKQRESDPSYPSRVREGVLNVEYALDHAEELEFVRNSHEIGGREQAADAVISITLERGNLMADKTPELHVARAMWSYLSKQSKYL